MNLIQILHFKYLTGHLRLFLWFLRLVVKSVITIYIYICLFFLITSKIQFVFYLITNLTIRVLEIEITLKLNSNKYADSLFYVNSFECNWHHCLFVQNDWNISPINQQLYKTAKDSSALCGYLKSKCNCLDVSH